VNDNATADHVATSFLIRSRDPEWSDDQERELARWLAQSTAHKAAFWRAEYGMLLVEKQLDQGWSEPDQAVKRILKLWFPIERTTITAKALAIAAGLIAAVLAGYTMLRAPAARDAIQVATKFNQIGTLELADGSELNLNNESSVRVTETAHERTLWLDRGEAYFEVAKDRHRPFVVHAGPARITVLGTKFAIRRENDQIAVSVLEGRVRLSAESRPADVTATLTSGAVASTNGRSTFVTSNRLDRIRAGLEWRFGRVSFDDSPLADAATQLNRYNTRKLVVAGAAARGLRISGSFKLNNPEGFGRLLGKAYGLKVTESEQDIEISF